MNIWSPDFGSLDSFRMRSTSPEIERSGTQNTPQPTVIVSESMHYNTQLVCSMRLDEEHKTVIDANCRRSIKNRPERLLSHLPLFMAIFRADRSSNKKYAHRNIGRIITKNADFCPHQIVGLPAADVAIREIGYRLRASFGGFIGNQEILSSRFNL